MRKAKPQAEYGAEIVAAWKDATHAYLSLGVPETDIEDGEEVHIRVEYIGCVPLSDLEGLTPAEQQSRLVAAAKETMTEQRKQVTPVTEDLGFSGPVEL